METGTLAQSYEVNKAMVVGGVSYIPGDLFDHTMLPEHKVSQFLRQRLIRPRSAVNNSTSK